MWTISIPVNVTAAEENDLKPMAFNPPTTVCDACILYPFHQRNILIQASADRLYDARWTEEIHDEWMRNLTANGRTCRQFRLSAFTRRGACVRTLRRYSRPREAFTFRAQKVA